MPNLPKIQFTATISKMNDNNVLIIRKILLNKDIIKTIVFEILEKGVFEFNGEIVFLDKAKALKNLREAKLI